MPVEKALASGFVCKICIQVKTRAGICRKCSYELGFTDEVSFEAMVVETLSSFLGPAIKSNSRIFLGGKSCADQIDGKLCETEAAIPTSGAYTDLPLLTPKQRISIEIDENYHAHYSVPCELKRYDTLTYGSDESVFKRHTVIRFNPHNSKEVKFELVDRLKVLVETVQRLLEEEESIVYDDSMGCRIIYLFYPAENPHKKMALKAVATLIVLPDVSDLSLQLRSNVDKFKLEDINKVILFSNDRKI
jgi:hypothetical protein